MHVEKKRLKSLKQKLDEKEDKLKTRKEEYLENTMKYDKHRQTHSQKRLERLFNWNSQTLHIHVQYIIIHYCIVVCN